MNGIERSSRSKFTFLLSIAFMVAIVLGVSMLDERNIVVPVSAQEAVSYVGPDACITCHDEQYEEWNDTAHSKAYSDPEFQAAWEENGNPVDCLQCHTTGFDESTGEYSFEGVTCESCHEAGFTMQVDTSPELCGSCHTGEWGRAKYEKYTEGIHAGSDVTCVSCHVYEGSHTFEVESGACASCHTDDDIHSRNTIGELLGRANEAEDAASQLGVQLFELQDQIEDQEGRIAFIGQVTTYAGLALGLVMVAIAFLYLRQRNSG
jgi:formate-dependent nitrite reductase cytochrome c552 subunit